jgi:catechol 2,3-dioxygenase-like lactoylglutathione lyase family enzyme
MKKIISGIQQMGIGVPDVNEIWSWYRKFFGIDIKVFEEAAPAPLMTDYTGGFVQSRTATLALSLDGGGGFEIWQFTSRSTEKPAFEIQLGDYGIFACKIKSRDIRSTYQFFKQEGAKITPIEQTPEGKLHFFTKDPNGNLFEIVEGLGWFGKTQYPSKTGGVSGAIIGVSSIEKSLPLYQQILGYTEVVYDEKRSFKSFSELNGGKGEFRRVLLRHPEERKGPFSELLGPSEIELIQSIDRKDCRKIFENRFWGDWGFIHLCFDVTGMNALKTECEKAGFPFTVDTSDTFDMGEAGGRFSYIEDPDGTLIEFVETHKVPLIKKIGWYIHLKNRNPEKRLPKWMLKCMRFSRYKA